MLRGRKNNASNRLFGTVVNKFIHRFPDLIYDGKAVKCLVCETSLLSWKASQCQRHINSDKHKLKKIRRKSYNEFVCDLTMMLIATNIAIHKVQHPMFRQFWDKYNPTWKLPSKNTLHNYVPSMRERIVNFTKKTVKNKCLWLTMDETTDIKKQSILSIVVRTLTPQGSSDPYLLACKRMQDCTATAIHSVLIETLHKFEILPEQVLMLVTDAAAVMCSTAKLLKTIQPNLLHVTCLLHALHLVTNIIRKSYPDVDELIGQTKAVFLKSPKRIRLFHLQCPDIPEPPQPILIRWGTWLEAAFYYYKHFEIIKSLVLQLDGKEAAAIRLSQVQFKDPQVSENLKIIYDSYVPILDAIKKLQNTALSLSDSLAIIHHVESVLRNLDDEKSVCVREKFDNVLRKNVDFTKLRQLFTNTEDPLYRYKEHFNYANITSLNVEQSFSAYKHIFTSLRTNLSETNTETYMMAQLLHRAHPDISATM